jgi:hypothetical protein
MLKCAAYSREACEKSGTGESHWECSMLNVELPGLARRKDFEVFGTVNSELRVAPVVHILPVSLTIHERRAKTE